nr:transcription initiation factor TFIIF small chain - fruit fly (Drosophila melanogaster) (fragments) [Drosophila melanogaster]
LVKVPKYIAQKWEKAPTNMDVGKLRINKTPGQKAQVSLSLTPAVLALDPEEYMEGRIVQKLECRPIADNCYMKLKLESIRKASEPQRRVQPIDKIVQNFKNIEYRERKKAEGKKARDDKNAVMDMLFHAFEKHQYYNIKDLVKITNQPISYLKEILKDVCDYNMK